LSSGMPKENILAILDGDTSKIPVDDAVAVTFAHHFADSKENPSDEVIKRLVDEYGYEKAERIVDACNVITLTNGMGISLDHIWQRLRFKRNRRSRLLYEVINPLMTITFTPVFILFHSLKARMKRPSYLLNKAVYSNS